MAAIPSQISETHYKAIVNKKIIHWHRNRNRNRSAAHNNTKMNPYIRRI